MIPTSSLRRALVVSVALHIAVSSIAWMVRPERARDAAQIVDIEMAPPAPLAEALPPELPEAARPVPEPEPAAKDSEQTPASTAPTPTGDMAVDAGVDAPPDAAVDAAVDARPDARPDAAPDAAIDAPADAAIDAPGDAALDLAATGDAALDDAGVEVAAVDGDAASLTTDADQVAGGGSGSDVVDAGADDAARVASGGAGDVLDAGTDAPQLASAVDAGADPARGSNAPTIALGDAGSDGGPVAAATAPGAGSDATTRGQGAAIDTRSLADALAAAGDHPIAGTGSGAQEAVEGAPTTAGTAANLLAYFPAGHLITALVRFDRLRGTEWSAQAERLLRPLPDYQGLFGASDAHLPDKLDTLVISTPRPRDAAATTLVARSSLSRPALRDFLAATSPIRWSTATGGLLGTRTGTLAPGDRRVILSPFQGWFVLAQPGDLGGLTASAKGDPDAATAVPAKLPPWLAGIRTIEAETGDPRGPAVVVTVGLPGKRRTLGGNDFGLGISSIPTPERISVAMELVPQGWLVRGNLRFASEDDAAELVAAVQRVQQRVADSRLIQLAIGKAAARLLANLAFARNGARVSYATSVSIADARRLLTIAAQQIDHYFARPEPAAPRSVE